MLQQNMPPTAKYHPSPLSHFLALHQQNQQHQQQQHQHQQNQLQNQLQLHHHHHPQHQQLQQPHLPFHHPANLHAQAQHHQHHQHQHHHNQHLPPHLHSHLSVPATVPNMSAMSPTNLHDDVTELDARSTLVGDIGKSFTIAAILGLKKQQQQQQQQHFQQHYSAFHPAHQTHPPHQAAINLTTTNSGAQTAPSAAAAGTLTNNNSHSAQNNNTIAVATAESVAQDKQDSRSTDAVTAMSKFQLGQHHHLSASSSALHSLQQLQQAHNGHGTAAAVTQLSVSASAFGGGGRSERSGKNEHNQHHPSHHHHHHSVTTKKSSLKSKRVRTIFTPEQLERLESEFERQQYMVGPERLYLAHTLQLTEAQVKVWFQNRRIKWRKHHLEITQQKLALIRQHQGPGADASSVLDGLVNCVGVAPGNSEMQQSQQSAMQQQPIECDLSVCTDSMDTMDSVGEADD